MHARHMCGQGRVDVVRAGLLPSKERAQGVPSLMWQCLSFFHAVRLLAFGMHAPVAVIVSVRRCVLLLHNPSLRVPFLTPPPLQL